MPDPDGPGSLEIDILTAARVWDQLPDAQRLVRAAARAAWLCGPGGPTEVSVLLDGDQALKSLNAKWRNKDGPTNVLSFPGPDTQAPGQVRHLGDIALSYDTLAREAAAEGKPMSHHLQHLVVHGMLHLQGYDHDIPADADEMEERERTILAGLGVPDPYAV